MRRLASRAWTRIRRALTRAALGAPDARAGAVRAWRWRKDASARADGLGKTAGYALPALHKLLKQRASPSYSGGGIECVVLKDGGALQAGRQGLQGARALLHWRERGARARAGSRRSGRDAADAARRAWHVVVATPGRLATPLTSGSVALERSAHAHHRRSRPMLSYGYEEDTRRVVSAVPRICRPC